jgi:hypothetical protein
VGAHSGGGARGGACGGANDCDDVDGAVTGGGGSSLKGGDGCSQGGQSNTGFGPDLGRREGSRCAKAADARNQSWAWSRTESGRREGAQIRHGAEELEQSRHGAAQIDVGPADVAARQDRWMAGPTDDATRRGRRKEGRRRVAKGWRMCTDGRIHADGGARSMTRTSGGARVSGFG